LRNAAFDAPVLYAVAMFTLEQITDIHDRLGNRDTLAERAVRKVMSVMTLALG
jgi:hypothetical protein